MSAWRAPVTFPEHFGALGPVARGIWKVSFGRRDVNEAELLLAFNLPAAAVLVAAERAAMTGRSDGALSWATLLRRTSPLPADHPRLVVLVAVDSPRTSIYGGDIAAPAVQKIMRFALQQLEIAP